MGVLQEHDIIILISDVMHHVPSFFLLSDASAIHGHDPNFIHYHNLAAAYVYVCGEGGIEQMGVSTATAVDKCRV